MPVSVIVGGQYGSEGKGKISSYLSVKDDVDLAVRCGGPNAGHTVEYNGHHFVTRQVPCGFTNPRTKLFLAAGSVVDPLLLREEVDSFGLHDRVFVDRNAAILDDRARRIESELHLRKRLASTLSGTGGTTSLKVLRSPDLKLAGQCDLLPREWIVDVADVLNERERVGDSIIIEGTQGFGLSLHHGDAYPYRTSRDTTASGFLSEVGLSPRVVTDIIMVVRTFPIRVGGNSGPLFGETDWGEIQRESGYPHKLEEITSVTRTVRRVARIDEELIRRASVVNRPTAIAIHGLDYISFSEYGKTSFPELLPETSRFVEWVERVCGAPATFLFTGPGGKMLIDRRSI